MTNTVGFRPKLLPPQGRLLERSYRPLLTCVTVSGCVTVLVCVVFGLTAFNIYSHRFGHTEHEYHAGDEMSLRRAAADLSATFCSSYTVKPMGWTDFYLLPHKAKLDPTKREYLSFTLTADGDPSRVFVQRVHYFTTNTTVHLSACYKTLTSDLARGKGQGHIPPALFLLIVGKDNFKEWQKHYNLRHAKFSLPVYSNATCDHHPVTINLTVPESNEYHFLLLPHNIPPFPRPKSEQHPSFSPTSFSEFGAVNSSSLTLKGDVNKTQLNLTGAEAVCNASQISCRFPLAWDSSPDVVAKIHKDTQNPDAPVKFITRCQERLEFWVPVFGGAPAVVIVLVWVWCWCLLVRKRELRARYRVPRSSQSSQGDYGSFREESHPPAVGSREGPPPPPPPQNEDACATIQG